LHLEYTRFGKLLLWKMDQQIVLTPSTLPDLQKLNSAHTLYN